MVGEVVKASKRGDGHPGVFDPSLLLDKLYDFSALTDEAQENYAKMRIEILESSQAVYDDLQIEMVQLL